MDDSTFVQRLLVGAAVLGGLAVRDLRRNGSRARLWRELSFIAATAAGAIVYAIGHDLVTCSICPEYFSVGKGIAAAARGFGSEVAWLATRAGWSVGVFIGLVLVVANNPSARGRPQLSHRSLGRFLAFPVAGALSFSIALGVASVLLAQRLVRASGLDLLWLVDPEGFVVVWAIHLGSYAGVVVGSAVAAGLVHAERRSIRKP